MQAAVKIRRKVTSFLAMRRLRKLAARQNVELQVSEDRARFLRMSLVHLMIRLLTKTEFTTKAMTN